MNVVVIGLGQSLRGDDAAGLEAVRYWQENFGITAARPEVRIEISELPGLGLLDLLKGAEAAVIVDAVHSSSPAGSLHLLGPDDLSSFRADAKSAHGWGAAETLNLGRTLFRSLVKCRITLIGIEAGSLEMGANLSPMVQAALPDAALSIDQEVNAILSGN